MATLQQVRSEIERQIRELNSDITTRLLGKMAIKAFADTKERIFTQGVNSDGGRIGYYAKSTAKAKKKKGRYSSSFINLRNTDQLVDSYRAFRFENGYALGWENINRKPKKPNNAKLVDILEVTYGDIFALTAREDKNLDIIINDFTKGIFE